MPGETLEIARRPGQAGALDIASRSGLPDLTVAQEQITHLLDDHATELLDEVRCQAEARSLYEKQKENLSGERHFAKLRLLAEAALGLLSYEMPDAVANKSQRIAWRVLGAGFERGVLLELCDNGLGGMTLSTQRVAQALRNAGYTFAPGDLLGQRGSVPWASARLLARERDISLRELPPDKNGLLPSRRAAAEQSRTMRRLYEVQDRLDRIKRQKWVADSAKEHGPRLAVGYGLLRQTLQALHEAQAEFTRDERAVFEDVFHHLYKAEDTIAKTLRLID